MPKPIGGSGRERNLGAPSGRGTPSSSTPGDGAGVGYDSGPRAGERNSHPLHMFIAGADMFACQ